MTEEQRIDGDCRSRVTAISSAMKTLRTDPQAAEGAGKVIGSALDFAPVDAARKRVRSFGTATRA
jgi:hypothetical protein